MKRALLSALLAALATGAVLATVGFGASSKSTTSSSKSRSTSAQTQSGPPPTMKQVHEQMETRRAAQQKKLAEAIGVSTSDLQTALDKVKQDRLAADVKANRLTQAQADAILACEKAPLTCDRSNLPAGGPRGRHGDRPDQDAFAKALASALGVSEAKVTEALEANRPERPQGGRGHRGGHGPGMGGHGPGTGGPGGMGGMGPMG